MNAVMKIEKDIEDHRIEWEAHGWNTEELRFVVANPSHKLEIKKAKENAKKIDIDSAYDLRSKLDFNFLSDTDDTILDWEATIWYMNFPIDARTSRNIVQAAMRMPKENIERLFFPLAPIEGPKKKFFDILVEYGRGFGMRTVGDELFKGARSGDPRAVKMYLEMMKALDVNDGPKDNLVRVEFEF